MHLNLKLSKSLDCTQKYRAAKRASCRPQHTHRPQICRIGGQQPDGPPSRGDKGQGCSATCCSFEGFRVRCSGSRIGFEVSGTRPRAEKS